MRSLNFLILGLAMMFHAGIFSQAVPMVPIKGGEFVPLYGTKTEVKVDDFKMDVYPVTNKNFQEFLKSNPQWQRSKVKKLFADESYLNLWIDDLNYGEAQKANSPVTGISWFAAKNYCECQGKRLPTTDEWEYAAMASQKQADAREEMSYNQYILKWYETPNTFEKEIGSTFKNYWGVYDLHGLVWEWTLDFNSVLLSGESRKDSAGDNSLFCGASAIGATDLMNYAAFMRYAFRGSVKANYSIKNLGFRCVQDMNAETI